MKESFGARLKTLRQDAKLGQVELAVLLGVSKGIISLWENNLREPTLSNIVQIAKFFNVTIDYLAGLEN
jgi:transcriptional regulator with XRE-family HTH domain